MRATYQTRPSSIPRMHAWRGSRSSRRWEWALLAFAVAASTALLGVATFGTRHGHAWPSLVLPSVAHHNLLPHHTAAHIGSSRAQRGSQGRQQQQQQQLRQQHIHMRPRGALEFPLWWHAPFIAQSGLGTEALSIIEALINTRQMQAEDIYVTHSGDTFDKAVLKGMSPATRNLLARRQHPQQVADEHIGDLFPSQKQTQLQRLADWIDTRQAIAVCMSWFDCWRRPGEAPSNMPGCPCPLSKKRTAFTVARTMFETAGLPEHLAEHVKAMDEVWVPTVFNKHTFTTAGVDPAKIRIVPEGIDTTVWDPEHFRPINITKLNLQQATGPRTPPYRLAKSSAAFPPGHNTTAASGGARDTPYVFLAVHKWEPRKGWHELVQGFCKAFKPSDPVVLWILARPFLESGTDFDAKVRKYAAQLHGIPESEVEARLPRIYTSSQHLSEADFISVYSAVDALVLPTHAEGWGRPQMEAMSMALPVITTNWSGPVAFLNSEVAYPLAIQGLQEIKDDGDPSFVKAFAGQRWAQPSVPHLVQLLQHVYTHPAEAAAKGKAARKHIEAHFTPAVVARIVAGEVRRLQGVVRARQQAAAAAGVGGGSQAPGKKGLFSKLGAVDVG